MTTAECIVLVVLAGLVALMVTGLWRIRQQEREWEWMHPPEDSSPRKNGKEGEHEHLL